MLKETHIFEKRSINQTCVRDRPAHTNRDRERDRERETRGTGLWRVQTDFESSMSKETYEFEKSHTKET